MNSFNWDKNFETGIGVVDEQHQYLVGFINHYGNLLSENTISIDDMSVALLISHAMPNFILKKKNL